METQGVENYGQANGETPATVKRKRRRLKWWWVAMPLILLLSFAFFRYMFFEVYIIPTPSCANTLMPGDYILVSKISYGPRLPITPVAIPFYHSTIPGTGVKSYVSSIQMPYKRMPGGKVQRGDMIVFNNPMGDTVILEYPNSTFHDFMLNACEEYNISTDEFYTKLLPKYTMIVHPVDRRENYIKRCVALPGDVVTVSNGQVIVNAKPLDYPREGLRLYYVYLNKKSLDDLPSFKQYELEDLNNMHEIQDATMLLLRMDKAAMEKISVLHGVDSMVPYYEPPSSAIYRGNIFPYNAGINWNIDNYGPLYLPRKGDVVILNDSTYNIYSRAIAVYENNKVEILNGHFIINGKPTSTYIFKLNYYWMMGDNRHNSMDSRFWGYVPEDHIIGKAQWIIGSVEPSTKRVRNNRWLKKIE